MYAGDLAVCQSDMWSVVDDVVNELAAAQGDDPTAWQIEGRRQTFTPGLIPDDFRATNRPTFQQLLEFVPRR